MAERTHHKRVVQITLRRKLSILAADLARVLTLLAPGGR